MKVGWALSLMLVCSIGQALSLGPASKFNLLVFEDMEAAYSDVEGRLAVGGNLTLQHYAVGMQLDRTADFTDSLIVGGHLSFQHGRIYHGNATSRSAELAHLGFYTQDPAVPAGAYRQGAPLNFTALAEDLRNRSAQWARMRPNGEVSLDSSGASWRLFLRGTDPNLNVFSLSTELLLGTDAFYLDAPLRSTVLINVDGIVGELSEFGFWRRLDGEWQRIPDNRDAYRHDGSLTQRVLFNFFSAQSLAIHAIGVKGSLLAPWADVVFYDGHLDGQLIAKSLRGRSGQPTGQVNLYPLIPEPATLWLILPLLGWLLIRWRQTAPQANRR